MSKQVGAVVTFKLGTTKEQAERALLKLSAELDVGTYRELMKRRLVQEFDPEMGGPVWYIP